MIAGFACCAPQKVSQLGLSVVSLRSHGSIAAPWITTVLHKRVMELVHVYVTITLLSTVHNDTPMVDVCSIMYATGQINSPL